MAEELTTRVFVAEDNDDLASLMARKIDGRKGWSMTRASTLEEAQKRLQGDRFDLVVLDYRLPDGTGLDLLSVVRATSPETPILFLTAHGSEDVALQAFGLGATDYMQKDGHLLDELPGRLDALLARSADTATAARVVPVQGVDPPRVRERHEARMPSSDDLGRSLTEFVKGEVLGGAIFDGAGRPLAALLPSSTDATRLGAAVFALHANVGTVARLAGLEPRTYTFVLEHRDGILAATTVAGRCLVAVLVDKKRGDDGAREKLAALTQRLH